MARKQEGRKAMLEFSWHFDFHCHKNIRINHNPDVAAMARTLRKCGVREVISFAKGHDGFAYYPTRVSTVHPRMIGDAFGEVVKACKAEDISVLAYVSFGIDGEAGRKHPEWVQVGAKGPVLTDDWFIELCPFTPYLDELVLPMIEEIVATYPVDGFFFDTMNAMALCYCKRCRRMFRERHGFRIPERPDDPNLGLYGQFRHERAIAMIENIGRFINERKPGAKVGFNQIGSIRYPERLPGVINCLTMDLSDCGAQSLQASLCAAYGSTVDRPSDVMNTIFNQGWGDWSPRPLVMLEQEAAAVWARKCRLYIGDRLRPENRLDPISVRAMQYLATVRSRLAEEYPAETSRLVPDFLVLNAPLAIYGEDMCHFASWSPGEAPLRLAPLEGAHHLLLDAGANFAIVAECHLENHLNGCKCIVLPEVEAIAASTETVLRKHVEAGGKLFVAGRIPNVNGKPLGWLGVSRHDKPWQDHIYLPAWAESDDQTPVLVRGAFHKLDMAAGELVLPAIRPYDCDYGMRFGWGIGPASDEPSEFAALTRCRAGKGEIWYLEAAVFSDYAAHANWTQIAWLRGLLERVAPDFAARVMSPSGTVEVVAHADEKTTWAFLVNHGGEQVHGVRQWARAFQPLPPFPVELQIRDAEGRAPRRVSVNGGALPWRMNRDVVLVQLTMNDIWRIVRVDWQGKT